MSLYLDRMGEIKGMQMYTEPHCLLVSHNWSVKVCSQIKKQKDRRNFTKQLIKS